MADRRLLAFDVTAVAGASVASGFRGSRVQSPLVRIPLPAGALQPSGIEPNLRSPVAVRDALEQLREQLRGGTGACLVLPDGVARLSLFEVPAGVEPRDFARFRLAPGLPYPADEAVVDVLPLSGRQVIAAAVRRRILEEYEGAAAAAGFVQQRLDLAPLVALGALVGEPAGVQLVLGDAAYCMAVYADGALRVLRNRRRDASAGEADRIQQELERTLIAVPVAARPGVRIVGAGARELASELALHQATTLGWLAPARVGGDAETAEHAWLGAALC